MSNKRTTPFVVNKAQTQEWTEDGHAIGMLSEDDEDRPNPERLPMNRKKFTFKAIDPTDPDKIGSKKVEVIVHEFCVKKISDPDFSPRTIYELYPDYLSEVNDQVKFTNNKKELLDDDVEGISTSVFLNELIYKPAIQEEIINHLQKERPKMLSNAVQEMDTTLRDQQLESMAETMGFIQENTKSSSSSNSSNSNSS